MIVASRFRPLFASEKLLAGPPYRGCRVSTDWNGTSMATLGESALLPDGRIGGKAMRTLDLKAGWRGFISTADDNGWPDQGDVAEMHERMFPELPQPAVLQLTRWDEVIDLLDRNALGIALRLSALPASSPLRKYTSADHQVLIWDRAGAKVRRLDPMHDHSLTYAGEWVPLADVRKAAGAIEPSGAYFVEVYPIGGWTAEARARRQLRTRLEAAASEATRTEKRLRKRIADLEATAPPECAQLVAQARAAGRESAFVQVLGGVQAMRTTEEE